MHYSLCPPRSMSGAQGGHKMRVQSQFRELKGKSLPDRAPPGTHATPCMHTACGQHLQPSVPDFPITSDSTACKAAGLPLIRHFHMPSTVLCASCVISHPFNSARWIFLPPFTIKKSEAGLKATRLLSISPAKSPHSFNHVTLDSGLETTGKKARG